ncbi:MAG: hypothetical protein R3D78_01960 [Paracoccaceae bacterium]
MDVVDLTRRLIAFDTINPPGAEAEAMAFCAALLEAGGFTYRLVPQGRGAAIWLRKRARARVARWPSPAISTRCRWAPRPGAIRRMRA